MCFQGCFSVCPQVQDTHLPSPLTDPDIMHPDESTSLLPEARSLNWRQKCCKHFPVVAFLLICLLLLANVFWSIHFNVFSAPWLINKILLNDTAPPTPSSLRSPSKTNKQPLYAELWPPEGPGGSNLKNEMDDIYAECIYTQVVNTLNCLIFLIIVARSPRFVGCFTILKNLVRLPRFWILVFPLVLYIVGTLLAINFVTHSIPASQTRQCLYYGCLVMDFLNAWIKVALVGALNQVQIRRAVRSRFKYLLLKGTLIVTCINLLCTLIGSLMTVYLYFIISIVTDVNNSRGQRKVQEGSLTITVMEMLLLPLVITTTELIWTKILQDNKCIIGKHENNSFTRQNPRISYEIENV